MFPSNYVSLFRCVPVLARSKHISILQSKCRKWSRERCFSLSEARIRNYQGIICYGLSFIVGKHEFVHYRFNGFMESAGLDALMIRESFCFNCEFAGCLNQKRYYGRMWKWANLKFKFPDNYVNSQNNSERVSPLSH